MTAPRARNGRTSNGAGKLKRVGALALRSINIVLAAAVILCLFAQAWVLALSLLALDIVLASSVRVQRATRDVRVGLFDLFTRCIRVTRFGVLFIGLGLLMGVAALNTGANLLYLMFGILISMVFVSGISSTIALSGLRFKRILPDEIYAGDEFVIRLEVVNRKSVFPAMGLLVKDSPGALGADSPAKAFIMKLGPRQSGLVRYVASIERRGAFTFDYLAVSTRFPFGVVEIFFDIPLEDEVIVMPRVGQLRDTVILEGERRDEDVAKLSFMFGLEEEFRGLRDFRRGDNPRHIHWRSSARHGKLVVKEFDRQEERNVCVFFDTYIGDRKMTRDLAETVERAVSFTATILNELARQGYEVYLAAHSPEFFVGAGGGESRRLVGLLRALATLEPSRRLDAADLFQEARFRVPRGAGAVLVRVCEAVREDAGDREAPFNGHFKVFVAEDEHFQRIFALPPEGRRYAAEDLEPSVVVA